MIRACPPLAALLLALVVLVWPGKAEANVNCSVTSMTINFGNSLNGTGSVNFSCTSFAGSAGTFTACSQLGPASYPGTTQQPKMSGGSKGGVLNFNLYTGPPSSPVWVGTTVITKPVTIIANGTVTGSIPFYGLIPSGQSVPADTYSAFFYNTTLGAVVSGSCTTSDGSLLGGFNGAQSAVEVRASVSSACTVSATSLAFGTVIPTATNLAGQSTLTVTCPNGTAYYIGLAPSNASTTGAGIMSGTGGNTDKPPYQLRSTSGTSGTIWGNTATTTSVGNGVAGTGNGAAQNRTVYATLPSANYRPDTYGDTVTVRVNY
ncbi:MAG TPA: spore coat protein U domain-containing protein [Croceibacterium sp.]